MSIKGVLLVPEAAAWTGPWLGATRRPSLQRVANRPIVCHVLDALREVGIVEVAIVAPSDAASEIGECIASEGPADMSVRQVGGDWSQEHDGALLAAAEFVGEDPCVVHHANGLLGRSLPQYVELLGEEAVDALLLVDGGGCDPKRLRLVPQPSSQAAATDPTLASPGFAGVCLLAAGALQRLAKLGCPMPQHDLAALAHELERDGGRVQVRIVRGWRQFSGDGRDLLDMNRTLLDALDPELTTNTYDGNRFEGPVVIHPTACVSSSVIVGPVMIGAGSLITDSYIGPHTSIGERVRIDGTELERSIVLDDASVLHVGGRLVASIVGRHARVFRDFSIPRALRLQVGDGDEVALC